MKRSEASERKPDGGFYRVRVSDITTNNNPRNPLSVALQGTGTTAWPVDGQSMLSLWELGTSQEASDRSQFAELIRSHETGPDEILELAATMLVNGQINPVTLREGGGGKYTCVAGARRTLAALFNAVVSNKPATVKATLVKGNETAVLYMGISENSGRKKPNPIEQATATQRAINLNQTIQEVAEHEGVSVSTIQNRLKLLELPDAKQKAILAGKLTVSKALGETRKKRSSGKGTGPRLRSSKEVRGRLDGLRSEIADDCMTEADRREVRCLEWVLKESDDEGGR